MRFFLFVSKKTSIFARNHHPLNELLLMLYLSSPRNTLFLAFFCLLNATSAFSQSNTQSNPIDTWFLEERFLIADKNEDALLSLAELQQYNAEFSYYLTDNNFSLTDMNRDGKLSFNEVFKRAQTEFIYRQSMERKEIRSLLAQHPQLGQGAEPVLRANPAIAERLFSNFTWLQDNAQTAARVYNDHVWAMGNRPAMVSLHKNLRWMVANPNDARTLYKDRAVTEALPELLGWRNAHKDLMRKYPDVERFEGLIFMR